MSANKPREIAAVDKSLLAVFRSLVGGKSRWPLFLHGPPGGGKSCACLALLDYLFDFQQAYITATELTSQVMASYDRKKEPFDWRQFGAYRDDGTNPPHSPAGKSGAILVALDELGTRDKITDTHYESVQRLIDARECQPLILISNLPIGGIGRVYDARIASRCEAGTVVELLGKDRRTFQ